MLFIFMTMEKFPINADDINSPTNNATGYVSHLQRNASMHIYCELHKQNKRISRASQNLC